MKWIEISSQEAFSRIKTNQPTKSTLTGNGFTFYRPPKEDFEVECWINNNDCYRETFSTYKEAKKYALVEAKKETTVLVDMNHYKDTTSQSWDKQMNFKINGKVQEWRGWDNQ